VLEGVIALNDKDMKGRFCERVLEISEYIHKPYSGEDNLAKILKAKDQFKEIETKLLDLHSSF
jgi:hypothetical protein